MSPKTPARSAATSTLTFSVSSWTSASPGWTASPGCFSQAPTVASTTDSPRTGTRTSTGMDRHSLQGLRDDAPLLRQVRFHPTLGRTGALGTADVPHIAGRAEQRPQAALQVRPGAHVARLLLQPHHLARPVVLVQQAAKLLGRERVQLLDPQHRQVGPTGALLVRLEVGPHVATAQHDPRDAVGVLAGP